MYLVLYIEYLETLTGQDLKLCMQSNSRFKNRRQKWTRLTESRPVKTSEGCGIQRTNVVKLNADIVLIPLKTLNK